MNPIKKKKRNGPMSKGFFYIPIHSTVDGAGGFKKGREVYIGGFHTRSHVETEWMIRHVLGRLAKFWGPSVNAWVSCALKPNHFIAFYFCPCNWSLDTGYLGIPVTPSQDTGSPENLVKQVNMHLTRRVQDSLPHNPVFMTSNVENTGARDAFARAAHTHFPHHTHIQVNCMMDDALVSTECVHDHFVGILDAFEFPTVPIVTGPVWDVGTGEDVVRVGDVRVCATPIRVPPAAAGGCVDDTILNFVWGLRGSYAMFQLQEEEEAVVLAYPTSLCIDPVRAIKAPDRCNAEWTSLGVTVQEILDGVTPPTPPPPDTNVPGVLTKNPHRRTSVTTPIGMVSPSTIICEVVPPHSSADYLVAALFVEHLRRVCTMPTGANVIRPSPRTGAEFKNLEEYPLPPPLRMGKRDLMGLKNVTKDAVIMDVVIDGTEIKHVDDGPVGNEYLLYPDGSFELGDGIIVGRDFQLTSPDNPKWTAHAKGIFTKPFRNPYYLLDTDVWMTVSTTGCLTTSTEMGGIYVYTERTGDVYINYGTSDWFPASAAGISAVEGVWKFKTVSGSQFWSMGGVPYLQVPNPSEPPFPLTTPCDQLMPPDDAAKLYAVGVPRMSANDVYELRTYLDFWVYLRNLFLVCDRPFLSITEIANIASEERVFIPTLHSVSGE